MSIRTAMRHSSCNCAHPSHFEGPHCGVRANPSRRSHADLNDAEKLADGNPFELGEEMAVLRRFLRRMNIVGDAAAPIIAMQIRYRSYLPYLWSHLSVRYA
jgi:hypothetical protein